MNLRDDEWEPAPTEPALLRRVHAAATATVSTHDLANLRSSLLGPPFGGAIPHELRGTIWLLLLRLRSEDLLTEDPNHFAQTARRSVADHNSREQIEKDVQRTRPGLARFKQPAVRGALLRLLSLFCERHKVAYVQGLNELLAPFILLADTGSNPRIAYALFSAFVARFAPWTLETSETRMFEVLKRLFKYFERLLLYHDPELYWLLDHHAMSPDLYATSWFITLFSRNFTVESVLALWDLLLLEDDPLGTSFFAIALLRSKRDTLMEIDESRIPETLMLLTAGSPEEVRRLWKIGSEMRAGNTPPSFQRLMTDRIIHGSSTPTRSAMSAARFMQGSVCLQTTPDDLIAGDAQFFVWDCRTAAEFNSGHLAQAAFLPLDNLRQLNGEIGGRITQESRNELQNVADLCEALKGSTHICLVGSGLREEDKTDINVVALYLTRLGVPYISTLRGGFEDALASHCKDETISCVELVDYDRRKHDQARRARIAFHKRLSNEASRNARRGSSNENNTQTQSRGRDQSEGNSFLDKSDAEVTNVLATALSGMGFKTTFSSATPSDSGERDPWGSSPSRNVSSSRLMMDIKASPTSSVTESGPATPRRIVSAGPQRHRNAGNAGSVAYRTASGPATGSKDRAGASRGSDLWNRSDDLDTDKELAKDDIARYEAGPSPWVRDAKPGWLGESTLRFPLSAMPRGFTVNILDDAVMKGLQLFPCNVRSERVIFGKRSSELKRRFVGVSRYYFVLLGPYQNRNHLLEVKMIRYLQDIVRITFKRSRPELVTFSILPTGEDEDQDEKVVCIMPDGLKDCVSAIREYISEDENSENDNVPLGDAHKLVSTDEQTFDSFSRGMKNSDRGIENDATAGTDRDDDDEFGELQSAPSTPGTMGRDLNGK